MRRPALMWTITVLTGLLFALLGLTKMLGASGTHWADRLANWGYPAGSRYVIGTVEIVSGVGLFVPKMRGAAAAALMVLMLGAFGTHLVHGEYPRLLPPLVLGVLLHQIYSWRREPKSS
jgi:putative oxidoreductase